METASASYQIIAQGFVVALNGIMVLLLAINWVGSRKSYLILACVAGLLELSRQIPNAMLAQVPDNPSLVIASMTLQFLPSLVLFQALSRMNENFSIFGTWLARISALAFAACFGVLLLDGLPATRAGWVISSQPLTLITLGLVWQSWTTHKTISAGRVFLIASSIVLLALRLYVPFIEQTELFFLLYYIENLTFPMLLVALAILEVEHANRTVKTLLEQRQQSEHDLKFILDSALDVILITDIVGLLKNWTRRAEEVFGFTSAQAVGQIHLDELFLDNNWRHKIEQGAEFTSRIEHVEGFEMDVGVRFEAISHKGDDYMIFVIRQLSEASFDDSLSLQSLASKHSS